MSIHFFANPSLILKIQTANLDSYRALIRYVKDENAEYHTYQFKEDKPIRVVIRNIHSITQTKLIKKDVKFVFLTSDVLQMFSIEPLSYLYRSCLLIWNQHLNQMKFSNFPHCYIPESKLKSRTNPNQSVNALTVRIMATQKYTVATLHIVFDAVLIINRLRI